MPIVNTNAETIVDAEGLLDAVSANAALLPNIDDHREPLIQMMEQIRALRAQQKTLTADKQKVSQDLKVLMREARDLTIQLRSVVRAKIGVRSEKLVEFCVPPLRKRPRKAKPPAEPEAARKSA